MKSNVDFKKSFISLLLSQRERMLEEGKDVDEKGGFKSVGEILASKEYSDHLEEKWGLGDEV